MPWLMLTRELPASFAAGSSLCIHGRHRQTSNDLFSFGKRILSFPQIFVMLTQTKQKRSKTELSLLKLKKPLEKLFYIILI